MCLYKDQNTLDTNLDAVILLSVPYCVFIRSLTRKKNTEPKARLYNKNVNIHAPRPIGLTTAVHC